MMKASAMPCDWLRNCFGRKTSAPEGEDEQREEGGDDEEVQQRRRRRGCR